jgi:hypothetical protein
MTVTFSPILISDKVISIAARWSLMIGGTASTEALAQSPGCHRFSLHQSIRHHPKSCSIGQTLRKGRLTEAPLKYFPQKPSSSRQPPA